MEQITFDKLLWSGWLQAKGLSPNTIKQYSYYFDKFEFDRLSQPYMIEYINHYNNNVARAFLKNLLHFIKTNDFPKEIKLLIAELEIPEITGRKKVRLPQILSEEQVFQLSNAMQTERNKIMTLLTFFGGLRVAELIKIKPYDFNWEAWLRAPDELGRLKVIGKGDKQRPVFVPSKLMARIYTWIKNEVSHMQSKDAYLFKISTQRWEQIVDRASHISLGRHINPHILRHLLPEQAQILTPDGWKFHNEIKAGDKVFSYNIKTNQIELEPILKIHRYNVNEDIFKVKNRYLDYLCTPEHKGVFKIAKDKQKDFKQFTEWGDWELISIEELLARKNKRLVKHRISGIFNEGTNSIGKAKAGLLGWLLTDGCITKDGKNISISQSLTANKKKCKYIEKLLIEAQISYSKKEQWCKSGYRKTPYQMCNFKLLNGGNRGLIKGTNNDWIFDWINKDRTPKYNLLTLKQEELQELYKCIMLGDGTNRKDGYNCPELTTQNKARIDFFRALCSILGKRTILGKKQQKGKEYFRTYIANKDNCELYINKQITKEYYKGIGFCPETANGTWIAKSNETIFITGNSCSTWLSENGFSLQEISEYLGHSSVSTTQLYVHLSQEKIKDKYQELVK